jgi:hypothetical protein
VTGRRDPGGRALTGLHASLLYLGAAVATTWPLAAGLWRDLPWDLGDSLLNCWILAWDADHLARVFTEGPGALRGFWSANIFHPEPLALAYSEHLIAQAVQILPVYAATGNVILCYNLLFLSTFVLSGLGTFLLVRDITGRPGAAFVAGLVFAFAPYRVAQYSHLQVLSSQWMPFALLGLRRFVASGRTIPLAWGSLALVAQNLSCGYYLAYFAPAAAAFALFEIARLRRWRDPGLWGRLALAAVAVAAATAPFVWPYVELSARGAERPLAEVRRYSADVYSYLTVHEAVNVWGAWARAYPKPEGELFPGATSALLAATALVLAGRDRLRRLRAAGTGRSWEGPALAALAAILGIYAFACLLILAGYGGTFRAGPVRLSVASFWRAAAIGSAAGLAALVLSRRLRAVVSQAGSGVFFALVLAASWMLSFGPVIAARGRPVAVGPYAWLHAYVPGFDGLRVPARFEMIVILALAVIAGFALARVPRRGRGVTLAAIGAAILIESTAAPIPLNGISPEEAVRTPADGLRTGPEVPAVFRFLATLPEGAAIVHFPFGYEQYELRYMFYSTAHWRPILNGYSGFFPRSYSALRGPLQRALREPDQAWTSLSATGATHAVIHGSAFLEGEGEAMVAWLIARGATVVGRFGEDVVLRLPDRRGTRREAQG